MDIFIKHRLLVSLHICPQKFLVEYILDGASDDQLSIFLWLRDLPGFMAFSDKMSKVTDKPGQAGHP